MLGYLFPKHLLVFFLCKGIGLALTKLIEATIIMASSVLITFLNQRFKKIDIVIHYHTLWALVNLGINLYISSIDQDI